MNPQTTKTREAVAGLRLSGSLEGCVAVSVIMLIVQAPAFTFFIVVIGI